MNFFIELKRRNELLFWFGLFNLAVSIACVVLMAFEETQLLGVNRWLKPFKFYTSVGLMVLTMGWLLYYLKSAKQIKLYSWLICISMFFENGLIITQAIRNTTSHFNTTSAFNGIIFQAMGFFITVFTVTVMLVCVSFFKQKQFSIPVAYVWSIRLGILFFLFFSLEGGMMLGLLQHTVGGPDGSPGLPVVNWSTQYGDLRIAHFVGIHSLQALPLFGYYISKTKTQTILFSAVYFLVAAGLFLQAMKGIPLFF